MSQTRGPERPDGDNHDKDENKKCLSEANVKKEEDVAEKMPPVVHAPAMPSPPPTVIKEMDEIFLRLGFTQTVSMKLVDEQGINSLQTLASLSDEDITAICNVIHRPGRYLSGKTPDRGKHISVLATKNLKLAAFMFKTMEHCSKDKEIRCVNSTSVLCYINRNWNRKRQMTSRRPKLIKITGQKLWST